MPIYFPPVPPACVVSAAVQYRVPTMALYGIMAVEGGANGVRHRNRDGSEDLGPMQINTRWLSFVSRYGVSREDVLWKPCTNVWVGAWILARAQARDRNIFVAIGHYHSYRPLEAQRYRRKVERAMQGLQRKTLEARR
ncbi:MAG: lytic transglycosylase domain-containing protein [Leptospirales bacterium]